MKKYALIKYIFLICFLFLHGCYFLEGSDLDYKEYRSDVAKIDRYIDIQNIMSKISHLALKVGPRPAGSVKASENGKLV